MAVIWHSTLCVDIIILFISITTLGPHEKKPTKQSKTDTLDGCKGVGGRVFRVEGRGAEVYRDKWTNRTNKTRLSPGPSAIWGSCVGRRARSDSPRRPPADTYCCLFVCLLDCLLHRPQLCLVYPCTVSSPSRRNVRLFRCSQPTREPTWRFSELYVGI